MLCDQDPNGEQLSEVCVLRQVAVLMYWAEVGDSIVEREGGCCIIMLRRV